MSESVTSAEPAVPDLDDVVGFASGALGVDETQALDVVEEAVTAVEHLLAEHRSLVADELLAEADRFTRGAFADGIRHAATVVLDPPVVLLPADEATLVVPAAAVPAVVAGPVPPGAIA